jgi:hypothetical protein
MISKELIIFLDGQDWDSIYRELKLHTVRRLYWAGLNPKEGVNGMDPCNIVSHVLESIYMGKRKPGEKGLNDFRTYLRWAINSVISNIKKKSVKNVTISYDEVLSDEDFFDQVCEPCFDIDEEKEDIISKIEIDLEKHDDEMYFVFSELILSKKHKEIARDFGWSISKVENIHKRIDRFIRKYKKAAEKINL